MPNPDQQITQMFLIFGSKNCSALVDFNLPHHDTFRTYMVRHYWWGSWCYFQTTTSVDHNVLNTLQQCSCLFWDWRRRRRAMANQVSTCSQQSSFHQRLVYYLIIHWIRASKNYSRVRGEEWNGGFGASLETTIGSRRPASSSIMSGQTFSRTILFGISLC